jgi:GntR family transcriptional repressor for pyruvate dehydrogenase complex
MKRRKITPLQPTKLAQGVFTQLCELIRSGRFSSGDRLPSEKELCDMFQVSRTTVRSGLQSLNALGLVESRDGSGTFVTVRSPESVGEILGVVLFHGIENIEEIYEGRRVMESWAAYLAAKRRNDKELKNLERLVEQQSEAVGQGKSGIAMDLEFHLQISKATRNEVVLRILYSMITLIFKVLDPTKRSLQDLTMAVDCHRGILEAIRNKDALLAMSRMYGHLNSGTLCGAVVNFPRDLGVVVEA